MHALSPSASPNSTRYSQPLACFSATGSCEPPPQAQRPPTQPVGHLETLHDVPTYITRGAAASNSTIILLTDGLGLSLVNNKLLADQYATRTGLRVVMPHFVFLLAPARPSVLVLVAPPPPWWALRARARRRLALRRLGNAPQQQQQQQAAAQLLGYVRVVRRSLPLGAKLGVAGFSVGGAWAARVSAEPAVAGGDQPLVDAHFAAHPLLLLLGGGGQQQQRQQRQQLVDGLARFRVPLSVALGGADGLLQPGRRRRLVAALREAYADGPERLQVVVYERCGHGFALRAARAEEEEEEEEGAEGALEQAVGWFRRYLLSGM